ncbi:MAG TPA: DnaA/Hda family protein [Deltaproteobacteria bacterium]|nr:DnaA/Hda family protein [Deltaproteobacteria bacterium]HQB38957.1 DnaA/Hda family protein [Deltaproteobacteria bacterium]
MQQIFDFPVTPACTFDSFVSCDGNAAALDFARKVISSSEADKLLYLHGPSGSGKTHLLKAVSHAIAACAGQAAPCLSCRELSSAEQLISSSAGAPALLVDDLHLLPDDAGCRNALWQLFNDFYIAGHPVVMTGLYPPRELPHIDDHLVSRLLWGLVARVDVSDDHSRRMILKKVADDRQVRVPEDVVDYILITSGREVGELIANFESIYRLSLAEKRRITLPLARESREMHLSVETHL